MKIKNNIQAINNVDFKFGDVMYIFEDWEDDFLPFVKKFTDSKFIIESLGNKIFSFSNYYGYIKEKDFLNYVKEK